MRESQSTVEPILQRAIEASAAEVFKPSQQAGNVPIKTGYLKKSFGKIGGRLFAKIGPGVVYPVNYAIFVHEGTKPHKILPKNKKALFWSGAAHPMKSVNHPGTRPNQFMPRILEIAKPNIDKQFKKALDLIAMALTFK